jgi:hypothetical protein
MSNLLFHLLSGPKTRSTVHNVTAICQASRRMRDAEQWLGSPTSLAKGKIISRFPKETRNTVRAKCHNANLTCTIQVRMTLLAPKMLEANSAIEMCLAKISRRISKLSTINHLGVSSDIACINGTTRIHGPKIGLGSQGQGLFRIACTKEPPNGT